MNDFVLHTQLAEDTFEIMQLSLCRVLLMNDQQYPWCILVPQRPGLTEMHHLYEDDATTVMNEIRFVSRQMEKAFSADKINVAALGNMVPQLHIHIIARYHKDPAWPGSVWGVMPRRPYALMDAQERILLLRMYLDQKKST